MPIFFIFVFQYFAILTATPKTTGRSKLKLLPYGIFKPPMHKVHQIKDIVLTNNLEIEEPVKHKHKPRSKHSHKSGKTSQRHIKVIPPAPYPLMDDPPSGLADDMKHSTSVWIDDSLRAQRRAFIAILDENSKNRKRPKKFNQHQYIFITYDYINKTYSIREEEDSEE